MGSKGSAGSGVDNVQRSKGVASVQETRKSEPVSIEIRGQRLTIRSNHEPAFVEGLASYVDGKVAELQAAAPGASFDKLLMLASMTVAEELFEAQAQLKDVRRQLQQRTASLFELLDECDNIS